MLAQSNKSIAILSLRIIIKLWVNAMVKEFQRMRRQESTGAVSTSTSLSHHDASLIGAPSVKVTFLILKVELVALIKSKTQQVLRKSRMCFKMVCVSKSSGLLPQQTVALKHEDRATCRGES
jgi:hypothetical protein